MDKKKITELKSEVRVLKDDRQAGVAAVELQSRVKTRDEMCASQGHL